jgi:hypothetical protein
MGRPECGPSENVVRAITTAHFDEVEGRIQSDLFVGPNTSVSRLAVLALSEIFEIFKRELEKHPRRVLMAGEINVGELQEIGSTHVEKPTTITVEEAGEPGNPAHAEIPQKLSRGLSKKIIDRLRRHPAP